MRIAVISANCGGFERVMPPVVQAPPRGFDDIVFALFDDASFPPRSCAMTPRLQARIPKMFGWEMVTGFDYYIWHDASYSMQRPDSVAWFIEQCTGVDAAFFKHPHRDSIREEARYISERIAGGDKYLRSRYAGELLDEQIAAIREEPEFLLDDLLIASSSFIYRNTRPVREFLREWWVHTSRYHAVDQLALPCLLKRSGISWRLINDNIYSFPYLTRTREMMR